MAVNPEYGLTEGFRKMTFADVPAVLEIEKQIYTHPWTEGIFNDCLRVGYHCWVYAEQDQLLAYGLVSIAVGEAHILNLCVSPDAQGRGLGKRMLYRLMELAEERLAESIFLEVRESNLVAQQLYETRGFRRVGTRKDYYPSEDGREHAYVYVRELNKDAQPENDPAADQ